MNKEKEVEAYLKNELPEEEKLKYEIAQELGVLDKVLEGGWKSLSAKETGRIGGLVASKRKENERPDENEAIFMAAPELIGYDATGRKTESQLDEIVAKYEEFRKDATPFFA